MCEYVPIPAVSKQIVFWEKSCVTHLLQQKSLLVLLCQLIGREGTLDSGPDHYTVILRCSRHSVFI